MCTKFALFTKCNFLVLISGMYQHTSEGRRFRICDENITKGYRTDCYFTYKHQSCGRYQYVFRTQAGIGDMENGFLREPLTTRSRFLVQKLRGSHLAKNFPAFCARKAITSYPQTNNPFPLHQFWFFSSTPSLPSGLLIKSLYRFLSSQCATCPAISSSLFDNPCVSGEEYKPRSPSVYSCLRPIVTSSLLDQIIPLGTLLSNTPSLCSSLYER